MRDQPDEAWVETCMELPGGWLRNWVTFVPWSCYFGDHEARIWVPETRFRWSCDPRGHPTGTWRSKSAFLWILGTFWESLGINFGHLFVTFQWLRVSEWEIGSGSLFLPIQGWKWCQNAATWCAINKAKTIVLEIFHLSHVFTNLVSPGRVLGVILMTFGDLGHTFSDSWAYEEQAWNLMVFQGFPGGAQILRPTKWRVNVVIQLGSRLQPTNTLAVKYKPITSKLTSFQSIHL